MTRTKLFISLAFLLVVGNAGAVRVLEILERSHELRLSRVTFPDTTNGAIGYSTCGTCAPEFMAVSGDTQYFVDGQQMTHAQTRQAALRLRQTSEIGGPTLVVLHYDPGTRIATRIRIETH